MAYGVDPTKMIYKTTKDSPPPREIDRFDECIERKNLVFQGYKFIEIF
jgi:hypothetical protein